MFADKKHFFLGAILGVAGTMVILEVWGNYLERTTFSDAQPHLLRPLGMESPPSLPKSSEGFPPPRLPETSGKLHDGWRVRSLDGKSVALAAFEGKVVFLNFWSTTCVPCIEEMPGIQRLYGSLLNERVVFMAVTQEDGKQVRSFLKDHKLDIPVYLADKEPPEDMAPNGFPTTFILAKNGAILFTHSGALNWDDEKARAYIRTIAAEEFRTR